MGPAHVLDASVCCVASTGYMTAHTCLCAVFFSDAMSSSMLSTSSFFPISPTAPSSPLPPNHTDQTQACHECDAMSGCVVVPVRYKVTALMCCCCSMVSCVECEQWRFFFRSGFCDKWHYSWCIIGVVIRRIIFRILYLTLFLEVLIRRRHNGPNTVD